MCRCHRHCCQTEEIQLGPVHGVRELMYMYSHRIDAVAAVISSYHFFDTHQFCVHVCECLFSPFFKMEHRLAAKRRKYVFNSKQHFSVKCQLIDFPLYLSLCLSSLFFVVGCVCDPSTIVLGTHIEKHQMKKNAFRIKAFL